MSHWPGLAAREPRKIDLFGWPRATNCTMKGTLVQDEKNSGDWLLNSVNVLNITKLYTSNAQGSKFNVMCILPQYEIQGEKVP